ncbi:MULTISPECIES: Crp/Fnr family transcriptional regulator [Nostocales]|uniref:Cyclic nucleotide-binding domain-containing protein n=3 Tax=Nostocales TaxID=1161 RepID=A0A0C1N3T1_9CYAN|nr:cyclic nucleotide-binding domain-containing protein [Tolypothrix bouteillei]KAF3889477.1 cyclic nucleotide-binding domain-containing protein [Tolypothrix bouteillei VB521301]
MVQPVETVRIFQKQSELKTYSAGQVIFTEGEYGEYMYGIVSGEVELYVDGKSVETIQEGDVFGEGALVTPEHTRASTAIAKTDCELAFINRSSFLFAVQETPIFALQVMRSYSERLRRFKHPVGS